MAKQAVNEIVKRRIQAGEIKCPIAPQGVTKERITKVLRKLHKFNENIRDAVFALLDDSPNWYPTAPKSARFCDGASTAYIGAHIAILQRGGDIKLDREGRDKWIKPLVDIVAVEKCYLPAKNDTKLLTLGNEFYPGHLKAKSPNSAYRLSPSFVEILTASEHEWEAMLEEWISENPLRKRLKLQAELAKNVKELVYSGHSTLIEACCNHYVPRFLGNYRAIYLDDGDGDRIAEEQKAELAKAGLKLTLHDAMPDILLWNEKEDSLWVIEAVTTDGEVDVYKMGKLQEFAQRYRKSSIGFTTAYLSWKKAAERQKITKNNLAVGSYLWIMEDGSKNFKIEG